MDSMHSRKIGRVALTFAVGVALAACSAPVFGPASVRPVYRGGQTSADLVSESYATGKAEYAAGHYGLAIRSFERELGRYPRSVRALNGLGACYDQLGRYDVARTYYFQALALAPDDTRTLNNLGYSTYLAGQYAEAAKLLALATAVDGGKDPVIAENLHLTEQALGRTAAQPGSGNQSVPVSVAQAVEPAGAVDVAVDTAAAETVDVQKVIRIQRMPRVWLEVSNGNGRTGMAKLVTRVIKRMGGQVWRISNADSFGHRETLIYYQPGNLEQARRVARGLPVPVELAETTTNRPKVKVRLVLGHDIASYFGQFEALADGRI
jgi:hypothetical protein